MSDYLLFNCRVPNQVLTSNMDAVLRIFFIIVFTTVVYTQDYCTVCNNHTMCIYQGVSSKCGNPMKRGLTDNERQRLINVHNKFRNTVATGQEKRGNPGPQPPASNMRKLVWNNEIAAIAQRWADQCSFGHDQCRNTATMTVGQNVYILYSSQTITDYDFEGYVQSWYDEVTKFDKNNISPFKFTSETGHYTQVVWADTYQVGCGFIAYPTPQWKQYYLVCNYAPAGNYVGQTMYKTGNSASACPSGTTKDNTYPGLCA